MINYAQFLCFCSMKGHYPVNTLLLLSSRIAPLAAASLVLAVLATTPAHALALSGTPFNGFFTTTVATAGFSVNGQGTSTNSPLSIGTENFNYTPTSVFPDANNNYSILGTTQFSDGTSILYATVIGTINSTNYTGTGTDTFSPTSSTGKFAGATGTATFTATVIDQTAKTIKDQYSGSVVIPPAAVPETSSIVSLGILLMLGLGGAVITARKKARG